MVVVVVCGGWNLILVVCWFDGMESALCLWLVSDLGCLLVWLSLV